MGQKEIGPLLPLHMSRETMEKGGNKGQEMGDMM